MRPQRERLCFKTCKRPPSVPTLGFRSRDLVFKGSVVVRNRTNLCSLSVNSMALRLTCICTPSSLAVLCSFAAAAVAAVGERAHVL